MAIIIILMLIFFTNIAKIRDFYIWSLIILAIKAFNCCYSLLAFNTFWKIKGRHLN